MSQGGCAVWFLRSKACELVDKGVGQHALRMLNETGWVKLERKEGDRMGTPFLCRERADSVISRLRGGFNWKRYVWQADPRVGPSSQF